MIKLEIYLNYVLFINTTQPPYPCSKMSLFKSREWWYASAGAGEDYDTDNICMGNVDNAHDGAGSSSLIVIV